MALKPVHLAVLMPYCAEVRDGGIAVASPLGQQVERLAELAGHTTILAYDPPAERKIEDRTDFLMLPEGGRMSFVSLGPRGSIRDLVARRRRVRRIVAEQSGDWDLLFLQLVNRRVGVVYKHSKCRRIFVQAADHTLTSLRNNARPWRKKALGYIGALIVEPTYQRIARETLFFVNGAALVPLYGKRGGKAEVVPMATHRARFSHFAADRLASERPNLVTVSRLSAIKGVDDSLRAFAMLRAGSMPHAQLHIVGSGPEEANLHQLATSLGVADAVTWHGWIGEREKLFGLLRDMDLLITLSHYEGLPNTIREAMAHSVLVVTTPVGAIPDVFDERDVMFVPEYDPASAVRAVEKLASDPGLRAALLARGRDTAAAASVEKVCDEFVDHIVRRWPELADTSGGVES